MRVISQPEARTGPAVLQVGPLYNNHLRRWSAHAVALGYSVCAAGHVRAGRRPVDLTGVADAVEVAPPSLGEAERPAWLREVVRRLDPDLIHAHWLPTWGYVAAVCADRPLVLTPWGSDVYLLKADQRRRSDWALARADCVLARSAHMERELLQRGVDPEILHRVDLGVDLGRFRPCAPEKKTKLRTELGLPAGPLILSMRAGTSLYNLDVVLEAFRSVRARVEDATLALALGDAPVAAEVRSLLSAVGPPEGVWVLGHLPHAEMARYVQAASAAVSIPSSDGSPSSVWEALAGGLPLVLSDLPQIAERVSASGAVKLVAPTCEAVAHALITLLEDPAEQQAMAAAARAWAQANCDEREQIERLGVAYSAVRQGRRRRAWAVAS